MWRTPVPLLMVNSAFNGSSKTQSHTYYCSSLPNRKCCSEHNVTSHSSTFITRGPNALARSLSLPHAPKFSFYSIKCFVSDLYGTEMFHLIWASVRFSINVFRRCQSCRQAGYVWVWRLRREDTERNMYSWRKAIRCTLWSQLPHSAVTAPIFVWRPQWNLWIAQETRTPKPACGSALLSLLWCSPIQGSWEEHVLGGFQPLLLIIDFSSWVIWTNHVRAFWWICWWVTGLFSVAALEGDQCYRACDMTREPEDD